MKRDRNDTAYAIGYTFFGLFIIFFVGMETAWEVLLALGFWVLAIVEFTGGEDRDRNYLFMILFGILPIGILFQTGYEYWVLLAIFFVWGAYEIVEERKIDESRWDLVGIISLLIGALLLLTGLMGNTFPEWLGLTFGILFTVQGLKEWFD